MLLLAEDTRHCEAVSRSLETNIDALERLPYKMRHRGKQLALSILHKGWAAEEDMVVDIEPDILAVCQWLDEVPE
jgi:hypothetical protein